MYVEVQRAVAIAAGRRVGQNGAASTLIRIDCGRRERHAWSGVLRVEPTLLHHLILLRASVACVASTGTGTPTGTGIPTIVLHYYVG